jgi:hypothetical protein
LFKKEVAYGWEAVETQSLIGKRVFLSHSSQAANLNISDEGYKK